PPHARCRNQSARGTARLIMVRSLLQVSRIAIVVVLMVAVGTLAPACAQRDQDADARTAPPPSAAPTVRTPAPSASRPKIVVLGDSLTAGLGIPIERAYPSLLQKRLQDDGIDDEVVNAGVSGDTSAGGLSRLDWALSGDVRVLVVALGGNDALR